MGLFSLTVLQPNKVPRGIWIKKSLRFKVPTVWIQSNESSPIIKLYWGQSYYCY